MELQLEVDSEVWLKLPYGDLFTQPHNKTNTVFIAGGTGITPFLSLFTHESFKDYINSKIYLGFRSKSYNIYESDLARSCNSSREQSDSGLVKSVYQDVEVIININQIFSENGSASNYFISGPPLMIKAFKQILIAQRVPTNQALTDDWE